VPPLHLPFDLFRFGKLRKREREREIQVRAGGGVLLGSDKTEILSLVFSFFPLFFFVFLLYEKKDMYILISFGSNGHPSSS